MCPPAAAPLADIDYHCTNEELIMHLYKLQNGSPLPRNVITDINPYRYSPENLPDEIWYLVRSEESKGTKEGTWEPRGEPFCIFSNNSIRGWRTTLEFFEGQTPHSRKKTEWIMEEFNITPNELRKNIHESEEQENSMLCRVFRTGEDLTDQDIKLTNGDVDSSCKESLCLIPLGLDSRFEKGSTSNHQENDESKKGIQGSPPSDPVAENPPENDPIPGGDFLELWDLVPPGSPSSSSDNSSCVTMSSDECFDSLALLQDLEPKLYPNPESRETILYRNTSASNRPDRIITGRAASGSVTINELRNLSDQRTSITDLPSTSSATGREKKRECSNENLSPTNSHDATPSTSRQSSDSEGSKKGNGKRPKKKYLCFLPFQFLF